MNSKNSMSHPYANAPQSAFWRLAISEREPLAISDLWNPKFNLSPRGEIATFGSCFAQHLSRELKRRGYNWLDAERAPDIFGAEIAKKYNYGVFSARTGNIYTTAGLHQWLRWAIAAESPPDEVWLKDGHYFDPFRPAIEPGGFASAEDLFASRQAALRALRSVATQTKCFVFTLGLTEGWINRVHGYTYAACPGTIAGTFDPAVHEFRNYGFNDVCGDLDASIALLRSVNADVRVLLTVSPVPLTATASGKHVLTATTYSKSVLRAVAGQLADTCDIVDYFPSYEIITGTPFQGMYYQANKRDVSPDGVTFVMNSFFKCLAEKFGSESIAKNEPARRGEQSSAPTAPPSDGDDDVVCEEVMLDAFSR